MKLDEKFLSDLGILLEQAVCIAGFEESIVLHEGS